MLNKLRYLYTSFKYFRSPKILLYAYIFILSPYSVLYAYTFILFFFIIRGEWLGRSSPAAYAGESTVRAQSGLSS